MTRFPGIRWLLAGALLAPGLLGCAAAPAAAPHDGPVFATITLEFTS